MKLIQFLLIIFNLVSLNGFANEISDIKLFTPVSYESSSGTLKNFSSWFQLTAGDLLNTNIKSTTLKKLDPYKKDLSEIFNKPGELDKFLNTAIDEASKNSLASGINDKSVTKFLNQIGNTIVGAIVDKGMSSKGVDDPNRRKLWSAKLLKKFNECTSNAKNALYEANQCITALCAGIVPNIGTGVIYEITKSKLLGSVDENNREKFLDTRVEQYQNCITPIISSKGDKVTQDDVATCAINSARSGLLEIANQKLLQTVDQVVQSPTKTKSIKENVWPKFEICVNNVSIKSKIELSNQFINCVDNLMKDTGVSVIEEKIKTNDSILKLYSNSGIKSLTLEKTSDFKKCFENLRAKNIRTDGLINIDSCKEQITNELTYKVVNLTFQETAKEKFVNQPELIKKMEKIGKSTLDSCWGNQQNEQKRNDCLKSTILTFSGSIASEKLDSAIPNDTKGKNQIKSDALKNLKSCLDSNIPKNLTESPDLSNKINTCGDTVTASVANTTAIVQIRQKASPYFSEDELNSLIKSLVQDKFTSCLNKDYSDSNMAKCLDELKINAAKEISRAAFKEKILSYFKENGGAESLNLSQKEVDQFINNLSLDANKCIDSKTGKANVDQRIDSCLKKSVHDIGFYFGGIKFNQSMGKLYDKRPNDKKMFESDFNKELENCLALKNDSKYSLDDYSNNLFSCGDSISKSMSLKIGSDQVDYSLNEYLKDTPKNNLSDARSTLKKELLENLNSCLKNNKTVDPCVDSLKKAATQKIVLAYSHSEIFNQLNTKEVPLEMKKIEDKFVQCTSSNSQSEVLSKELDDCTKLFAIDFAKSLGKLKVESILTSALGTEAYSNQKLQVDSMISKFNSCLDGLNKYSMADGFTEKLKICTDELQTRGLNIVTSNLNSWMNSEQKDSVTISVKNDFAKFIPCLSVLFPSSPYTPQIKGNVDSILKPVAKIFAQYIDYSPENAKKNLNDIIKRLSSDLKDIESNPKSKQELVDMLYDMGVLDQLIKGVVQDEARKGFTSIKNDDLPLEVRNALLSKENFDKIFSTPEGKELMLYAKNNILKPALVDQKSMGSPAITNSIQIVKDQVASLLVQSPTFGDTIIIAGIQSQMKQLPFLYKFFGPIVVGSDAFKWENVRTTPSGKIAENYIKEKVLLTKFKGIKLSSEEEEKIGKEAKELVTTAVKNYKKEKV